MANEGNNWIERVVEGGLPKAILGPAGAAISRLLGATVEIPASWLEGIAQANRDRTAARSAVSSALAESAAKVVGGDPALADRALNNLLAKEYRAQENKDQIARIAVTSLIDEPPPENGPPPSDQFLTRFERYAGEADDAGLREMFGRLLAGEVREAGSVSAQTLHFVSMLDPDVAKLIQTVLPFCSSDLAYLDAIQPRLSVLQTTTLEQVGFWTTERALTLTFTKEGKTGQVLSEQYAFILVGDPEKEINLEVAVLSGAGRGLLKVVDSTFNAQALIDAAGSKGANYLLYGRYEKQGAGFQLLNPQHYRSVPRDERADQS